MHQEIKGPREVAVCISFLSMFAVRLESCSGCRTALHLVIQGQALDPAQSDATKMQWVTLIMIHVLRLHKLTSKRGIVPNYTLQPQVNVV